MFNVWYSFKFDQSEFTISEFQRARAATTLSQTDNREREERLLPTVFKWEAGGKDVYLSGTFNNWKSKIPLAKRYFSCETVHHRLC